MTNKISETIFFWKPDEEYGFFSNWHQTGFHDDNNIYYENCEQYVMAHKAILFGDIQKKELIMKYSDPKKIKFHGRQIKNFNESTWNEHKYEIMVSGCFYKFMNNEQEKKLLLNTGNKFIAESSKYDFIWGIGLSKEDALKIPKKDWPGQNLLGQCLMEVRSLLTE